MSKYTCEIGEREHKINMFYLILVVSLVIFIMLSSHSEESFTEESAMCLDIEVDKENKQWTHINNTFKGSGDNR